MVKSARLFIGWSICCTLHKKKIDFCQPVENILELRLSLHHYLCALNGFQHYLQWWDWLRILPLHSTDCGSCSAMIMYVFMWSQEIQAPLTLPVGIGSNSMLSLGRQHSQFGRASKKKKKRVRKHIRREWLNSLFNYKKWCNKCSLPMKDRYVGLSEHLNEKTNKQKNSGNALYWQLIL